MAPTQNDKVNHFSKVEKTNEQNQKRNKEINMKKIYVVISEEKIGSFDSYKQAKECIRDCIKFDVESKNPFDKKYYIKIETDYDN